MLGILALSLGALSLGAGCMIRSRPAHVGFSYQTTYTNTDQGELYVANPPPAVLTEYQPIPPSQGYVWVSGYWDWTGYDWYWINGHWVADRPGYAWVTPRVMTVNGRWVYHRGYWHGHAHGGVRDYHYGRPAGAPGGVGARQGVGRPAEGWRGQPAAASRPYVGQPAPAARPYVGQPATGAPAARPYVGQPATGAPAQSPYVGQPTGAPAPNPYVGQPTPIPTPAPGNSGGAASGSWTTGTPPSRISPFGGNPAPAPSTPGAAAPGMPRRSLPPAQPNRPGVGAIGEPSATPTTSAPSPGTYRKMPAPTPFQRVSPSPMPSSAPRQLPGPSASPSMRGTRAPSSPVTGPGRPSPQPAAGPSSAPSKGRRTLSPFGR